ncbi:Slp family lipoprotein [Dyella sp. M7H15-1]|uniref:Slp family lipoprotein n=1 Tax=Dyella sp. M7H15-1 TaxID=2501295 RepID=UPI0010052236|nr:Slp family lipoprotein [Dyella sp. M7H15-1]QAU23896.1 Slp family lipoprotein [Dyella sp. M7H15-1]
MSPLFRILSLAAACALLAACATVPQPLQGNFANVTSLNAQQSSANGTQVRWGGDIISTEPSQQSTCFYVLGRPLDNEARPVRNNNSQGRFVACRTGFYDPEVFKPGREITITGAIQGTMTRKVGDYDYAYPRVEAEVIYLWPKRPVVVNYPYYGPGWYDPFWGPYWGGPYWGWGGLYAPVIVVRHHR